MLGERGAVFVSMSLGSHWAHNTEAHPIAGDTTTWSPDVMIPVTSSLLAATPLELVVRDQHGQSRDPFGHAVVACDQFTCQPNVWVTVTGDAVNKGGSVTGQFSLKAKYRPSCYPKFDDRNKSLMRQALTVGLFDQLKDRRTPGGVDLLRNIRCGVDSPSSEVGVTAGDEASYETFRELFDPVLEAYHGVDLSEGDYNVSNQDSSELDRMDQIVYEYVVSSHVESVRNVKGYALAPAISDSERVALESALKNCLGEMKSEFSGEYYSLGDMTGEERNRLESLGLLLTAPPAGSYLDHAGISNDWPRGRGVFSNGSNEFAVHVNGPDHLRVLCQNQGGDIGAVFEDWISANNGLEHCLSSHGMTMQKSDRLGYITTSPADVGSGLRAGMVLRLPCLGKDEAALHGMCSKLGLRVARHPVLDNCWEVFNVVTLGKTEVEIVQQIIDGVSAITQQESDKLN